MVDPGERELLGKIPFRHIASHHIQKEISRIFPDQHTPIDGRQQAQMGSQRQYRQEAELQGGEECMSFIGHEVIRINGIIRLQRNAFTREVTTIQRLQMGLSEIADKAFRFYLILLVFRRIKE